MSLARSFGSKLTIAKVVASPIASSSSASFSTSAPTSESKARRKSRLVRKNHLEAKASIARTFLAGKPDAVTGYAMNNEALWETSLLKSVLLDRKVIWGEIVAPETVTEAVTTGDSTVYVPQHFNFGLTNEDADELIKTLPAVAALCGALDGPKKFDQAMADRAEKAEISENEKRDKLIRIIDLRNADSKGIRVENVRRIVTQFAVTGKADTGSPEVQAAILTAKIHTLTEHCTNQPRDIHNRRPLRQLVQARAKILKYLRRVDVNRYEDCLAKIGVEARAVQGEVIITKASLRALITAP